MKKTLLILGIAISLTGCITVKYGSSVEIEGKRGANTGIYYKSNKVLTTKSKPKGGYVYINVAGITIGMANTENWTCIISDKNNKQISKTKGSFSIPSMPTQSSMNMWTNLMLARLDTNITDEFKVKVINNISKGFVNFNVYPNQDIRKKK